MKPSAINAAGYLLSKWAKSDRTDITARIHSLLFYADGASHLLWGHSLYKDTAHATRWGPVYPYIIPKLDSLIDSFLRSDKFEFHAGLSANTERLLDCTLDRFQGLSTENVCGFARASWPIRSNSFHDASILSATMNHWAKSCSDADLRAIVRAYTFKV